VIAELLKKQGYRVFLGGNIGFPLLPRIEQIERRPRCGGAFQLPADFHAPFARCGCGHQRHTEPSGCPQGYAGIHRCQKDILLHQGGISRTVLNADNPITASFLPLVRGTAAFFSRKTVPSLGAYLGEDGMLYCNDRSGSGGRW